VLFATIIKALKYEITFTLHGQVRPIGNNKHFCKAGQRQSIKIANRSFESVAKFKYLETTLTD
jgi:hypothetical protein